MSDDKVIDAEFEEVDKPLIDEISQSLEDGAKLFETRAPELSEALKEAAEAARAVKDTARKLGEDYKEAKRLSVQFKELFDKINNFRGSQEIKRDF